MLVYQRVNYDYNFQPATGTCLFSVSAVANNLDIKSNFKRNGRFWPMKIDQRIITYHPVSSHIITAGNGRLQPGNGKPFNVEITEDSSSKISGDLLYGWAWSLGLAGPSWTTNNRFKGDSWLSIGSIIDTNYIMLTLHNLDLSIQIMPTTSYDPIDHNFWCLTHHFWWWNPHWCVIHHVWWQNLQKIVLNLVGGLDHKFYFPIYWECHHPNWRTPSFFQRGRLNHQPGTL